jgi:transcriptional regulator with XRE-family HTH domain
MTTSDREGLDSSEWQRKGATLSDKTARKEFGLTQEEIVQAIRARKLQYREGSMFGNPWLRFLRREVEALVKRKHGGDYLKNQQAKTELARVNRELKRLKSQVAALENRKSKLMADVGPQSRPASSKKAQG